MANDIEVRRRVDQITWNSSFDEINQLIKYLDANGFTVDDFPKLREIVVYVYEGGGRNGENPGMEDDIAKFLGKTASKEIKNKLTKRKLDALVEEFLEADIKRKSEIADEIQEIMDNFKSKYKLYNEVQQFIFKQREIREKLDKELSDDVLDGEFEQQVVAEMDLYQKSIDISIPTSIEDFAEEMALLGADEEDKRYIKELVMKVVNGEKIPKGVNEELIRLETEIFVKKNKIQVEQIKIDNLNKKFELLIENTPDGKKDLIIQYRDAISKLNSANIPNLSDASNYAESALHDQIPSPGKRKQLFENVKILIQTVYTKPKDFNAIVGASKNLVSSGFDMSLLPNISEVRSFQELMSVVNSDQTLVLGLQKVAYLKIQSVQKIGQFVSKFPGGSKLVGSVSEMIGGTAIKEFLTASMTVIAEQGSVKGTLAILNGIVAGSTATAEAGGSASLLAALAPLAEVPVIGWVVLALAVVVIIGGWLIDKAIKFAEKVGKWMYDNMGIDLLAVKNFVADKLNLGNFVGWAAQITFNGVVSIFGTALSLGIGMMVALMPLLIGVMFIGGFLYGAFFNNAMISSLVPPPPMAVGGTCEPKGGAEESGTINCNQDAPKNETGINKDVFADTATRWRPSGTNYAKECFDDTVNRALCAKVNPQFALWVWLHESGASNYGLDNVEDFGIHGNQSVPAKNYDLQIRAFLNLDPASKCIKDSKILESSEPNKYWLALATNFLTGGCDPEKGILQSDGSMMTGKRYLKEELEPQWGWIKTGSLPANIHVPKGGSQCDGSKTDRPDNEYTRPDGVVMVCDGPVDENGNFIGSAGGGAFDPTSPPLVGEIVEGECSVSKSVVLTKQCGQAWSNKGLPGGSGTICSAGCGPSSVSSIVRTKNGSYTPDTIIFEAGSPYDSMDGGGSSLGQAQESLTKHGYTAGNLGICSQKDIANWICAGKAVIILADSYTGNGGNYIGHILPVVAVSGGKLITKDPYYSNTTPFVTGSGIVAGQIKELRQCLTIDLKSD